MRSIWVGLKDLSGAGVSLPQSNDAIWRFSKSSRYKRVGWRAIVLDNIAAIGGRDESISAQALDNKIDSGAEKSFLLGDSMVYLNSNIGDGSSKVWAFTAIPLAEETWSSDDTLELADLLKPENSPRLSHRFFYLLFSDGSVGHLSWSDSEGVSSAISAILDNHDPGSIEGLDVFRF